MGGKGADAYDGGQGSDTASYRNAADDNVGEDTTGVTIFMTAPSLNTGEALGDSFLNIQNIEGSAGDDFLAADDSGVKLYGLAGDDKLRGGAGDDQLFGGAGDDVLVGGAGDDILDGGHGADELFGNWTTSLDDEGEGIETTGTHGFAKSDATVSFMPATAGAIHRLSGTIRIADHGLVDGDIVTYQPTAIRL